MFFASQKGESWIRRENKALVNEAFVKVLGTAQELKLLKTDEVGFQCSRPTSDNANRSRASHDIKPA
jgi:hypothetical protein